MKRSLKFLLGGIGIVGSIGVITPIITSCSFDFQLPKPKPKQKFAGIAIGTRQMFHLEILYYQVYWFDKDEKPVYDSLYQAQIGDYNTNTNKWTIYNYNVEWLKYYYQQLKEKDYTISINYC